MVVCRHREILATIVRLINNNPDWNGTGCATDEEAVEAFKDTRHQVVLIGAGVDESSEAYLKNSFTELNPTVKVVQHYGGGSGLLSAEIMGALNGI